MKLLSQLRTSKKLGWSNCAAVALYRLALSAGVYQRQLPVRRCPVPEALSGCRKHVLFISEPWFVASREACLAGADALLAGRATWFSNEEHEIGSPPDWFLDPASGQRFPDGSEHWSRCKPFAATDVKRCWELSRWGWAPLLARAWRFTGDSCYLDGLNTWTQSWCQANPVHGGLNWLCGQEASLRLLHAFQAWQLSDAPARLPNLHPERAAFAAAHLQRIAATELYAQAQDNNHWTSEAAALFIGGNWLVAFSSLYAPAARHWAKAGRRALERSVSRLVLPDGSFAQHSVVYHRLVIDTLAQVEIWRRWLNLEPFSIRFTERCCAATTWLTSMVDPISGDAPNLGSNDGAFCYQLHTQHYRDFRPTLQLASVLFQSQSALPPGPWDEPLHWLGLVGDGIPAQVDRPAPVEPITLFADGGYVVLRPTSSSWALFRLPKYRFRPAHADPLHFDLWHQGVNLLRDGGSYSYNPYPSDIAVFPGIATHNTVQFDGAEPMPRLGRFLWGDWLQLEAPPKVLSNSVKAAYRCPYGRHQREVKVDDGGLRWTITDTCSDFKSHSLLRWRLCPGDWRLNGSSLRGPKIALEIECDQPIARMELVSGWESRHYGAKTTLPVLEVTVAQTPATLITSIQISV